MTVFALLLRFFRRRPPRRNNVTSYKQAVHDRPRALRGDDNVRAEAASTDFQALQSDEDLDVLPSEEMLRLRAYIDASLQLASPTDSLEERLAKLNRLLRIEADDYWESGDEPVIRVPSVRQGGNHLVRTGERREGAQPQPEVYRRMSAEERQQLADSTAATINHTLAMLFLRLGPPPAGVDTDSDPVTAGGGGVRQ